LISLSFPWEEKTYPSQIVLGGHHSCAIDNKNNLKCWGDNHYGQVGNGRWNKKRLPTLIPLSNSAAYPTQIALGGMHSCAIDNLKNLNCWGRNDYGQLGNGANVRRIMTPIVISLGNDDTYATQIALGKDHSCTIDNLNNLLCWGQNWYGQLGDGTRESKNTPAIILLGNNADATYATQIALGAGHTCAIDNLNNLKCWGSNSHGQLGDGTRETKAVPTIISLGDDTAYATQIALGSSNSCAIDDSNNLKCWGSNYLGQLGDGTYDEGKATPTIVSLGNGTSSTIQVAQGAAHVCAINDLNNLLCWGWNSNGELGDGTTEWKKNTPTIISFGKTAFLTGEGTKEELTFPVSR